ncbi:MAG: alpha/beta hydrolase-fold protein [Oscillospiraceae bacterium]|nr:alpha/beta hydrolase-fold protein [Oscillospiraceae bacterium]
MMTKAKKRTIIITIAVVVLIAGLAFAYTFVGVGGLLQLFATVDMSDKMTAEEFTDAHGQRLLFRLSVPDEDVPVPDDGFPLVLFLHGAGGRGNDNTAQTRINTVMQHLLGEFRADFPCIIVAPQVPDPQNGYWSNVFDVTIELLDTLKGELPINPDRVYITGLSMGGGGTWGMIAKYPNYFAAAAPICGWGDSKTVSEILHLPIWAFHGALDWNVRVRYTREMVDALKAAGSTLIKYTEYPFESHCSWELAYRDRELYEWMFAQIRSEDTQ